jgi:aryl-phospho-beta-D-glucosidase BglC (GH1 family)
MNTSVSRKLLPLFLEFFAVALFAFACEDQARVPNDTQNTDDETGNTESDCSTGDTFAAAHGQLRVEGRDLVDSCGEPVQLKGVSSMWLNWEYDGYATNFDAMKWMVDNWHISVFRAAMGTEAQNGYLINDVARDNMVTQVRQIVDNAIALGIYVIIDWHTNYASAQTAESIAFFTEMAQLYGQTPNVMYEPWNEPLAADWETDVKPYHEAVVSAIRAVDPDNIIILGSPQWSQLPTMAIDSPVSGDNLMYTMHFYSCTHGTDIRDNAWVAYNNDVPIFVTEWGATHADGGLDGIVCETEAEDWMKYLDKMNTSWVAWKLDGCSDSSCLLQIGTPVDGGWNDYLHGHGPYVVDKLLE